MSGFTILFACIGDSTAAYRRMGEKIKEKVGRFSHLQDVNYAATNGVVVVIIIIIIKSIKRNFVISEPMLRPID